MDYIIGVGSDESDYGALYFEKSGLTIEQIFNDLKKNKFKKVTYNKDLDDEFIVWLEYKAKNIDEDLIFHIKNDWMSYDSLKDTEYYVIKNG